MKQYFPFIIIIITIICRILFGESERIKWNDDSGFVVYREKWWKGMLIGFWMSLEWEVTAKEVSNLRIGIMSEDEKSGIKEGERWRWSENERWRNKETNRLWNDLICCCCLETILFYSSLFLSSGFESMKLSIVSQYTYHQPTSTTLLNPIIIITINLFFHLWLLSSPLAHHSKDPLFFSFGSCS